MIAPEIITVGNTSWKRDHNGKWNCSDPLRLSPADTVPLWDRKGEVNVTRIPDLVVGGVQAHGFAHTQTFESAGIPLTTKEKLYVGVQTGLPLRQITERERPRQHSTTTTMGRRLPSRLRATERHTPLNGPRPEKKPGLIRRLPLPERGAF